jgi:AcrR family transcriptional regulator
MTDERTRIASDRLLDAAAAAFEVNGVRSTTMLDVAEAADCSRGTVYRYFANRDELLHAFVQREMVRIGAEAIRRAMQQEPGVDRVVEMLAQSVELVAATSAITPFLESDALGITNRLGASTEIVDAVASALPGLLDVELEDSHGLAEWLVRIILSFLTLGAGARDSNEVRAYLRAYVGPIVPSRR